MANKKRFCKPKAGALFQTSEAKHVFKESNSLPCSPKPVEKVLPVSNVGRSPLDTLETTSENSLEFNGTAKNDPEKLRRRARLKYFMQHLSVSMAELRTVLEDQYRDSFYCSSIITVKGDKAKSTFCKRRWCMVCNNIRTAQLITKYIPTIQSWRNKSFLTLTVKNPTGEELPNTLNKMYEFFTEIKDSERKAGRKLIGIRKLEITFNPDENTYHPHFHFIIRNGEGCAEIAKRWLYKFNPNVDKSIIDTIQAEIQIRIDKGKDPRQYMKLNDELEEYRKQLFADPQFQDYKPADDKSAKYLFKYFVKLAPHKKKDRSIYTNALDLIFQNLLNRRAFQSFGFVAHAEEHAPENMCEIESSEEMEELIYDWDKELSNWINRINGDFLTDFTPDEKDKERVKNIRQWTPSQSQ